MVADFGQIARSVITRPDRVGDAVVRVFPSVRHALEEAGLIGPGEEAGLRGRVFKGTVRLLLRGPQRAAHTGAGMAELKQALMSLLPASRGHWANTDNGSDEKAALTRN